EVHPPVLVTRFAELSICQVAQEGDARHRLHPGGKAHLRLSRGDLICNEVHSLLARSALGIQRCCRNLRGEALVEPRETRDIVRLFTRLSHTAAHSRVHRCCCNMVTLENRPQNLPEELHRVIAAKIAAALSLRGTDPVANHWFCHESSLFGYSTHAHYPLPFSTIGVGVAEGKAVSEQSELLHVNAA